MHHSGYIHHESVPDHDQPYPANTPEAFDVNYNGDYSGDAHFTIEGWRVKTVVEADGEMSRHGQPIVKIKIPIEILMRFVSEAVRDKKVEDLEMADYKAILGL